MKHENKGCPKFRVFSVKCLKMEFHVLFLSLFATL